MSGARNAKDAPAGPAHCDSGFPSGHLISRAPSAAEQQASERAAHRQAEAEALAEELFVHTGMTVDIAFAQAETFLCERDRRRANR